MSPTLSPSTASVGGFIVEQAPITAESASTAIARSLRCCMAGFSLLSIRV
jgi:hypothetical protein